MYRVVKIMTDGGMCFESDKDAKKYLENEYGNRLTSIAHKILEHDKYTKLCEFLDDNLCLFEELIELRNEIKNGIVNEEDD